MKHKQRFHSVAKRRQAGFTLIEAALTTVIVGVGVLAIVSAQQAYHIKNDWAQRTGTAQLLANELREMTLTMPMYDPLSGTTNLGPEVNETGVDSYDDLDDFSGGDGSGMTFNPPINALRIPIDGMDNWTQQIVVENVLEDHISATTASPLGSTNMMRVTVTVLYQDPNEVDAQTVTSLSWVVQQ